MIEQFKAGVSEKAPGKKLAEEQFNKYKEETGKIKKMIEEGKEGFITVKNYLKIATLVLLIKIFSGGVEAKAQTQIENFDDKMELLIEEARKSQDSLFKMMDQSGSGRDWYFMKDLNGVDVWKDTDENYSSFGYADEKDLVYAADYGADGSVDYIVLGEMPHGKSSFKAYTIHRDSGIVSLEDVEVVEGGEGGRKENTEFYKLEGDATENLILQAQASYTKRLKDALESAKEKAAKEAEKKEAEEKAAKEEAAKPFKDLPSKF